MVFSEEAGRYHAIHQGVVLDYKDLKYNPCNDVIIPSVIATDQLQKPLGRYYMYYAPAQRSGRNLPGLRGFARQGRGRNTRPTR